MQRRDFLIFAAASGLLSGTAAAAPVAGTALSLPVAINKSGRLRMFSLRGAKAWLLLVQGVLPERAKSILAQSLASFEQILGELKTLQPGDDIRGLAQTLDQEWLQQVLPEALKMAAHIAAMPPLAAQQIKEVVLAGMDASLDAALMLERKANQLLFATRDLGMSPGVLGMAQMLGGAGVLLSAFIVKPLTKRYGAGRTILIGLASTSLCFALTPTIPAALFGSAAASAVAYAILMFFFDCGVMLFFIPYLGLRQKVTPDPMLGRMTSTMRFLTVATAPLGALAAGWQAHLWVDDDDTRAFLQQHNPGALRSIGERLLEAMQRGLWAEPGDHRERIQDQTVLMT